MVRRIEITKVIYSHIRQRIPRLTHVGGEYPSGKTWLMTIRDAVWGIETERWVFHVRHAGQQVPVRVTRRKGGEKTLVAPVTEENRDVMGGLPDSGNVLERLKERKRVSAGILP